MKLDSIKSFNTNNHYSVIRHNSIMTNPQPEDSIPEGKQKVFASNLGFKASMPITLVNDYKWFINNDKMPAIEALLKINAPKESIESLFRHILTNEKLSYEFIDSIVKNPRLDKIYAQKLKDKLPERSILLSVFEPNNPYRSAYQNYLQTRFKNASSISELLKIRPDWKEDVLLAKHKELYNNNDFEIGIVPESIGEKNLESIIQHLEGYVDFGFKTISNIQDLTINGRTYSFKKFVDGKSEKNVFLIETPEQKKFIIKMAQPYLRGLNTASSIGTCCIIDSYLTQNNCRNSAPLRYYNHNSNTAIYDFIVHKKTDRINNLSGFVENMPDFADLGLRHNDTIGNNNYFLLDKSQNSMKSTYDFQYGAEHKEFVSVDNDHVTYNQLLNPVIYEYNCFLPNGITHMFI